MNSIAPERLLTLLRSKGAEVDDDPFGLLESLRNASGFLIEHREAEPTPAKLRAGATHVAAATDIVLTPKELRRLLDLYPAARIHLAVSDDAAARTHLIAAIAHFFCGSSWPVNVSPVEYERFLGVLRTQAGQLGFKVSTAKAAVE